MSSGAAGGQSRPTRHYTQLLLAVVDAGFGAVDATSGAAAHSGGTLKSADMPERLVKVPWRNDSRHYTVSSAV